MNPTTGVVQAKLQAQRDACYRNGWPHFARPVCGTCGKSWAECGESERVTLEQASNTLITGCPFCHESWCD